MTAQERATPFHCPYCGDEDLRPQEDTAARSATLEGGGGRREGEGAWLCGACRRVFTVKFIGLRFPEGASK
ncbi:Insertion element protein [Amycolatopsis sp. 3B14]|uniref:Insertion element protein n=1 Tax=Amycolatopsis sp. 3B14 TaxID=3243600 RepID=UPI003D965442